MEVEKLEKQVNTLMSNIEGWQTRTIESIASRVGAIGKISPTDLKQLKNLSQFTTSDMNAIVKELAQALNITIKETQTLYQSSIADVEKAKQPLYDYRELEPIPFASNKRAQEIVKQWAKTTGETMLNLGSTKALNLVGTDGIVRPFTETAQDIFDKAVVAVTSGGDFYGEMRQALKQLGNGSVRIQYGSGVSRRLDTVLRSNILYGAKNAYQAYNDYVGYEVLGCDGFEVDAHANSRPSHIFMNGVMFSKGKARTVKGVYYPSGDKAESALQDYNCLHSANSVLLGISEPAYSKEYLQELKESDEKLIEYNGQKKTGYEWQQEMRKIETQIRYAKDEANVWKASGDMQERRITQTKINALTTKYNDLVKATGLQATPERSQVSGFRAVKPSK